MNTDQTEQRYGTPFPQGNINSNYIQQEEEQQPQQQQVSTGSPYYQPMIMPSEKADLYDKIRPEDVIETVKYLLMGYRFDQQRMQWIPNPGLDSVSLSEVGATQIATILFTVSNKSVSISKLTDPEIRMRTKMLVRTAMKKCLSEWEDYGIKSAATFPFIREVVLSIAFITLKQPEGAGVRTFIQDVTQESRIIQEQPKKEGAFGAIFRR